MRLRGCMAVCFFGALVCAAKWPIGRLRGYPRCVGVASKSRKSNRLTLKGRTADDAGTVNFVAGGGCAKCGAPAQTIRLPVERESAAQRAIPRERGRDTTLVPDAAAAAQHHPETDAFRRLPFASSHDAPSAATQPAAFLDCQTCLDSLLAGNYAGERDKSVLEAIADAFFFEASAPRSTSSTRTGGCASRRRSYRQGSMW